MPNRVRLVDGGYEWTAEIAEDDVRVTAADLDEPGLAAESSPQTFVVRPDGDDGFHVEGPDGPHQAFAAVASDIAWVSIDGQVFEMQVSTSGRSNRSATRDHDALAPPMSATVVRIVVAPGDRVHRGDLLVSLEAMKMELPIRAPRDGTITAVLCREGDLVQPGNVLVEM